MIEEVNKTTKANNWEERIEHKVNMLFDEILELESELTNIRDRFFEEKIKREKEELHQQLEDKTRILHSIDSNYNYFYTSRCEKRDRFNGIER